MLKRWSHTPVSNFALFVYLVLGIALIGQLKTVNTLATLEPAVRTIYIISIIVFAAYDSFVRRLEYRCKLCGDHKIVQKLNASRFLQLFVIASTIFFSLLLITVATFLVYIFLTV
ncbi:MAG: hypothetical protein ABH826_02065 [Patescibacteria group bacterium]|nr:hypothetical protein [Patescibacteria group bacterium]